MVVVGWAPRSPAGSRPADPAQQPEHRWLYHGQPTATGDRMRLERLVRLTRLLRRPPELSWLRAAVTPLSPTGIRRRQVVLDKGPESSHRHASSAAHPENSQLAPGDEFVHLGRSDPEPLGCLLHCQDLALFTQLATSTGQEPGTPPAFSWVWGNRRDRVDDTATLTSSGQPALEGQCPTVFPNWLCIGCGCFTARTGPICVSLDATIWTCIDDFFLLNFVIWHRPASP